MAVSSVTRLLLATCTFLLLPEVLAMPTLEKSERLPTYDYGIPTSELAKRQEAMQSSAIVTGVTSGSGPDGSAPLRPNILDLEKDSDTWTLYILALDMMQYTDQAQMFSWYQVAGIHGRPYLPWDGATGPPGGLSNGYCTHVSILFPVWHRPYLALYEQILSGLTKQIAQYWPAGDIQDRYAAAADNFRIPYWDWAAVPPAGQSVFPNSMWNSSSITIDGPAGTQTIANPLFDFQFKPLNVTELPDWPLNQYQSTMRYPTTLNNANATSQSNMVADAMNSNSQGFRDRLYNLFTNYQSYLTFSNEAWLPDPNSNHYDSIESLHDSIHGTTGGSGGHMTYIEYSGFDPAFWLHHAMIDRSFAMWQAIYSDSYVVAEPTMYGTFTTPAGAIEDNNTTLTPFRINTNGDFHTPITARYTETFGYSYAETANNTTPDLISARVIGAINQLYGATSPSSVVSQTKVKSKTKRNSDSLVLPNDGKDPALSDELAARESTKSIRVNLAPNNEYREWIANFRVKKNVLSGPFFIHFFIGNFSSDPFDWSIDPNLVGTHSIFVKISAAGCSGCQSDHQVRGTMPLTSKLLKYISEGELESLEPEDVEPFLKENLQYRIVLANNTAVPNEDVPDLVIEVASSVVKRPTGHGQFPKWGSMNVHLNSSSSRLKPFAQVTGDSSN